MKKRNNSAARRPSYTLVFVLLLAVILLCTAVFWQFFKINTLYGESQEQIRSISGALDELVQYSKETPADTGAPQQGISVEITYPREFASDSTLEGLLNTVQGENARSLTAINNLLLIFSIFITVVVVMIPIFNYVFIQKEQLLEIRKYLAEVKEYSEELEEHQKEYVDLARKLDEMEERTKKQVVRLEAHVKQAAVILNILALGRKGSVIEFIEPLSDSPEDRAQALALNARIDFANDLFDDAIKKMTDAICLAQNNADYHDTRSFMYFEAGEYDNARKDAEKAISLETENAKYHIRRAIALHALRRYKEALDEEDEAIRLDSKNSAYYKQRSTTLCSLRRYEEAVGAARKAHDLDSSAKYSLAWALYLNKQCQEALTLLADISKECKQYLAFRTRAMVKIRLALEKKKRITNKFVAEIKADLQRAIDLNGKYPYGYIRYAEAMILLKKFPEAKEKLDRAMEIDPTEPDVYHWYAEYCRATGDEENAKKYDKLADDYGYIPEPKDEP